MSPTGHRQSATVLAALAPAFLASLASLLALAPHASAQEVGTKGHIEYEYRYFPQSPADPRQMEQDLSIAAEATFEVLWDRGDHNLVITPFVRKDPGDGERTHWDFREFRYEGVFDRFELRIGLDKVYWGVTEFVHLVDIINQTDLVDDMDGEEKLGQPMVNLAVPTDLGTLNLFVLPYFRERTFPGIEGRPRIAIPVDTDRAFYDDPDGDEHVDYAVRWNHFIGNFDIGVSWFKGTGRDPLFTLDALAPGGPVLVPTYVQIEQTSLDLQATFGAWLLKFEGLTREERGDTYEQATGGFEYTLFGLGQSGAADLGIVAEYAWDARETLAPQPANNDLFLGLRLALNDENSTALLAGVGQDLDTDDLIFRLEAERRLGQDLFLSVEGQIFTDIAAASPLASFESDDFLQIRIKWFF